MTQPKSIVLTLISILVNGAFMLRFAGATPLIGAQNSLPVVMYHGMGDSAYGSITYVGQFIEQKIPGIYVTSIQMGDNVEEDIADSFFMNLNDQVSKTCEIINNDPKLKNGYNAIGFSQGGQIMRALAQRCPSPPMNNLISIGGQHQGVFGLPHCMGNDQNICDYVRKLLSYGAYLSLVQDRLVQAQYWHDPRHEDDYRESSIFLADINNERTINLAYKQNLQKLKNFVMVKFNDETIVEPKETEWFGFYEPNSGSKIQTLQESKLYQEDRLGLKEMEKNGQLIFLDVDGDHLRFNDTWFNSAIIEKYLKSQTII